MRIEWSESEWTGTTAILPYSLSMHMRNTELLCHQFYCSKDADFSMSVRNEQDESGVEFYHNHLTLLICNTSVKCRVCSSSSIF